MRLQHPHRKPLFQALMPLGLSALLLLMAGPALAQWKWRDAAGKVQYSDLPPPAGVAEKDILQRPPGQRQPVVIRPIGQEAARAETESRLSAMPNASLARVLAEAGATTTREAA